MLNSGAKNSKRENSVSVKTVKSKGLNSRSVTNITVYVRYYIYMGSSMKVEAVRNHWNPPLMIPYWPTTGKPLREACKMSEEHSSWLEMKITSKCYVTIYTIYTDEINIVK